MTNESKAGPSFVVMSHYKPMMDCEEYRVTMRHGGFNLTVVESVSSEVLATGNTGEIAFKIISHVAERIIEEAPWLSYNWIVEELVKLESIAKTTKAGTVKPAKPEKGLLTAVKTEDSLDTLADNLPGMLTPVLPPCVCGYTTTLRLKGAIMHLNDYHDKDSIWSRDALEKDPEDVAGFVWTDEDICQWLDELHDNGVVDLSVEIPDKEITV
jgi:hypothetical protein